MWKTDSLEDRGATAATNAQMYKKKIKKKRNNNNDYYTKIFFINIS